MSNKKITVDQLEKEILASLDAYIGTTEEACEKGVTETAKDAVKALRNAHPAGSGRYGSWDEYNKGWKITQTKNDKRNHKECAIHNATHYQLTHLLEKGHALQQGGRAQAYPHIAPVAEKCEDELVKNIRKWI